ncbi:MAG: hypothetical protein WD342_19505 [Verrucomicrobiales bacterium]
MKPVRVGPAVGCSGPARARTSLFSASIFRKQMARAIWKGSINGLLEEKRRGGGGGAEAFPKTRFVQEEVGQEKNRGVEAGEEEGGRKKESRKSKAG